MNITGLQYIKSYNNKKIFHLHFDTARNLGRIFIRFQEYYESTNPDFRGQFITLPAYYKWFRQTFHKEYHEEFCGFNLPSMVLQAFQHPNFYSRLRPDEKRLVHYFKNISGPYFVIGTSTYRYSEVFPHEMIHAFYDLNSEYRHHVDTILQTLPTEIFAKISQYLQVTYIPSQILTEMNAYLTQNPDTFKWLLSPEEYRFLDYIGQDLQKKYKKYSQIDNLNRNI